MNLFGHRLSAWQLFGITLVLTFIIASPSLLYPLGRDQGIHAYVGAEILNGNFPYRDVFVQKGPFGFLIYTVITGLTGPTTWGIRLFDLIWQTVGYGFLFAIARRRLSLIVSLLVVLLTAFAYHAAGFWHVAHHEGHLTPVLLFAVWGLDRVLAKDRNAGILIILSGAAVAATFWFKQTAGVYAVAMLIWVGIDAIRRRDFRLTWPFAFGIGLVFILMIAVLFFVGMLLPMLEVYDFSFFSYPALAPDKSFLRTWRRFFRWWNEYALITYPAFVGFVIVTVNKKRRDAWYGIQLLTLASIFSVYVQEKFWYYHWVSTLPFLALFAGVFFDALKARLSKFRSAVVFLLLIILLGRPLAQMSAENWLDAFAIVTGGPFESKWRDLSSEIPALLADLTEEDDPIFVWGDYTILYYFSERTNPTAYPMDLPLSAATKYQEKWQEDAIDDLRSKPPQLILLATSDSNEFEAEPSIDQLRYFPALEEMLTDQYVFDFHLGEFEVYSHQNVFKDQLDVAFGDQIVLKDASLRRENIVPGGELIVSLHWMPEKDIVKDYTVFVQLIDWSKPGVVAQNDSEPAWGRSPTSLWTPGISTWDTHIVFLPDDLHPGTYDLIVGLYNADTLERLPIADQTDDYYSIFQVVVD